MNASILPGCKCPWTPQETDCYGDGNVYRGVRSKDSFNPEWNTEAVLVEEMQRMAKRIEELEALAQPKEPEQEPVAWMIWGKNNVPSLTFKKPSDKYVFDSLYTTPPQRKPLTNDAARKLWSHIEGVTVSEAVTLLSVVRATEAAHGIKE